MNFRDYPLCKSLYYFVKHTAPMRGYYPYEIEQRKGSYFPILGYVVGKKAKLYNFKSWYKEAMFVFCVCLF